MVKAINGILAGLFTAWCVAAMAQVVPQAPAATDDAQARSILQRADEIRFPQQAFQVEVRVTSTIDGEPQEPRHYRILSKGSENSIVLTLGPEIERGQNMLLKGRELWIFMPNVSQPVRLSLSQRLTGQVANGDLARANFAGDYSPDTPGLGAHRGP